MSKHFRRRHFVDKNIQGRLLHLFVRCWALSLLTAGGLTLVGWIFVTPGVTGFVGPGSFMSSILPMLLVGVVASLLVMPLMMRKLIRDTHRFAGPLVRFKRYLREAADTGELMPIHFRDEDDWQELPEAYNDLIARIQRERLDQRERLATMPPTDLAADHDQGSTHNAAVGASDSVPGELDSLCVSS